MGERRIGTGRVWVRLLLVAPLLAAALAVAAPAPAGAAFACTTRMVGGTIKESVVVPPGAGCVLEGTVVRGGITVEAGGSLGTFGAEIRGSVTTSKHNEFALNDHTVVRGNVAATGGTFATAVGGGTEVRGDMTLVGNGGRWLDIHGATVRGNVTVDDNHVDLFIRIHSNIIDVDLSCANNTPAPTNEGLPNTVGGATLGRCAGL